MKMDLVIIKLCVIVGLVLVTFSAACLPLLFILPFLRGINAYKVSDSSKTGISGFFATLLPCFKSSTGREGRLSTSSEFSTENGSLRKSPGRGHGAKTLLFLDIMNCFSGGVFLGTSFLALMPEIREIFDEVGITWPQLYGPSNSSDIVEGEEPAAPLMPITEILVTSGLFLILCIEQVVHSITDRREPHIKPKENSSRSNSTDETNTALAPQEPNDGRGKPMLVKVTSRGGDGEEVGNEVLFDEEISVNVNNRVAINSLEVEHFHAPDAHGTDSTVRSLILLLTLSVHSILEGLAIGLQKNISSALSIFVAVLFHKSLMAFSMGNNLVQAGQSPKMIVVAASILATTSPTGIALGMLMKESYSGTELVNGSLQAIATGTFLFITFFEVLSKEFENHTNRVVKTISFVSGYLSILGIMFLQHGV